jgi:K+ transport systems, NAD-binding component
MSDQSRGASLRTYLLYLLAVIACLVLAGATGFYLLERGAYAAQDPPRDLRFGDALWWAIVTMTTIGYGDFFPYTPGGRAVAVLMMLFGIGTLGISTAAIAAYFVKSDQIQQWRVRGLRGHVVICGLGEKGLLLTRAFRERGATVVVIEQNETNEKIDLCYQLGAIVLTGDATKREILARARVAEARYLIAVCPGDGANAEIAAHARDLVGSRRADRPLTCSTHVVDPELWHLLRRWEIAELGPFRLQFFNVYDVGARALLSLHPPFVGIDPHTGRDSSGRLPHLLVVGAERLAQRVALHAARLFRDHHPGAAEPLHITLVGPGATDELRQELYFQNPGIEQICRLHVRDLDPSLTEFQRAAFLHDPETGQFLITAIYICMEDETTGLSAALALMNRARRHDVRVVVRMTQDEGLGKLLAATRDGSHGFDNLHAFGFLEHTCQPDLVLGGTNEALARAIHEKYLREQERQGATRETNPALLPWDQLPEEIRESNRAQADHIGQKLRVIGCDISPLATYDTAPPVFTSDEVEQMARMEHERWMQEKRAQGVTFGPRDAAKKTNPNLLAWEELPEESKKFNRDGVRELPALLEIAGFQIYRLQRK